MQKQVNKKTGKQIKKTTQTVVSNKKENENKTNIETAKVIENKKEESILKPLFFFAVFAFLIGGTALHFYLNEPLPKLQMRPQEPTLNLEVLNNETEYMPEEDLPEDAVDDVVVIEEKCVCPDVPKDDSQTELLKARIHDLEMENLILKEKADAATDTTPLLIELLRNIYVGKPFAKQLSFVLKQDHSNAFALEIQKQLGSYAIKGIPTNEQIEFLFDSRFQIAADSFYITSEDLTYLQQMEAFVKSLVRVYPKNVNPKNAKGIEWLYLAKKQVDDNDFSSAIESIHHLPNQSAVFFNDFIEAANQRVLANKIITLYFQGKEN